MNSLEREYGTPPKATEGVWFKVKSGHEFKFRFYDPNSVQNMKVREEIMRPFQSQIRSKTLSPEKDRELAVRAVVRQTFIDWRAPEGETLPDATEDEAVKLFSGMPRLWADLVQDMSDAENFQTVDDGTISGN